MHAEMRRSGWRFIDKLNQQGSQAVIALHPVGVASVAVRGTELPDLPRGMLDAAWKFIRSDLPADLYGKMVPDEVLGGHCHAGIKAQCDDLAGDVLNILDRLRYQTDLDVMVTGHSLGGAVATRLAALLRLPHAPEGDDARHGFNVTHLVTLGSPAIGDAAWCRRVNEVVGVDRNHRLVNCCDIVPRLWSQWLTSLAQGHPAQHAGPVVYIDRQRNMRRCTSGLDRLADRWTYRKSIGAIDKVRVALRHHSLASYIDRLGA
jgi:pimeloyl-ACP methyl ester carboxylesterase